MFCFVNNSYVCIMISLPEFPRTVQHSREKCRTENISLIRRKIDQNILGMEIDTSATL